MTQKLKQIVAVTLIAAALTGCATVNPQTGKQETNVGQSAGFGATIGAIGGALLGGKKGALIGAVVGGGAGWMYGLQARQKELEEVQKVAASIREETRFVPVVATKTYTDKNTNQTATGLQKMEIATTTRHVISGGKLNARAETAFGKMNDLADEKDGNLTIVIPPTTSIAVLEDIKAAAPRAKIITGASKDKIVITLAPKNGATA